MHLNLKFKILSIAIVADNFVPLPEVIYLVEHIVRHYIEITVS